MLNKKAQGMPMNVIIIAIIVLVVLVILIAFFAGGFGSVVGKVRDLFTGTTSGQSRDIVVQTCQNLCDTAKSLPDSAQKISGYCKQSFVVDMDSNPTTLPERVRCGDPATEITAGLANNNKDDPKKIASASSTLNVDCTEIKCV